LFINLVDSDVKAILAQISPPAQRPDIITRTASLTEIAIGSLQTPSFDFTRARLLVAPLQFSEENKQSVSEWVKYGFAAFFSDAEDGPRSVSAAFTKPLPYAITSLRWSSVRVAVDGTFTASFVVPEETSYNAWSWLLTGGGRTTGMLGVIYPDNLKTKDQDSQARSVVLPSITNGHVETGEPPEASHVSDGGSGNLSGGCSGPLGRVPTVATEKELADNPTVYTEDPGAFCTPFRNPERILSERSFYSIIRIEQPEISARASEVIRRPAIQIHPDIFARNATRFHSFDTRALAFNPTLVAPPWQGLLAGLGSGRHVMDSQHPMQWEGDSLRYQATTVAKGHILEFRMRTRSNGYSLGGVAKTMTLAPRQTKRKSRGINKGRFFQPLILNARNSKDRMAEI